MKMIGKAAVAVGGMFLAAKLFGKKPKKKKKSGSSSSAVDVVAIPFENGGESFARLRKGDRIVVSYDAASPWRYVGLPTDVADIVEVPAEGTVEFEVMRTMEPGGISQVYVQALDENDEILGQHKITLEAP